MICVLVRVAGNKRARKKVGPREGWGTFLLWETILREGREVAGLSEVGQRCLEPQRAQAFEGEGERKSARNKKESGSNRAWPDSETHICKDSTPCVLGVFPTAPLKAD